jgi:two-component system, OmpR family, sensor histidine kinase CiaH
MNEIFNARVKLTIWYVIIIMVISAFFSGGVYRILVSELQRGLRAQVVKAIPTDAGPIFIKGIQEVEEEIFTESKKRILHQLIIVNITILGTSGLAAYFLAGKSLLPIEHSLNEQKRFTADASHELRTPLTSIKTEIEVALRDKNLTLKEAKKLLVSNLEEVDKMQSLSNYLLSLTKYQNGEKKLTFVKVKLKEVISEVLHKSSKHLKDKDISIEEHIQDLSINGNQIALTELITILIDNAIKYSHKNTTITVTLTKEIRHTTLKIQDEGIGIKESDIAYIFNRFYRADTSRSKDTIEGYGLGLSIAKSIADIHHARIEVESVQGKGSTFSVIFHS